MATVGKRRRKNGSTVCLAQIVQKRNEKIAFQDQHTFGACGTAMAWA
tara:strand:+ start:186 stop:326 length:141 start_codon:yes stop_codon:yes gene_type:complete